jgi:hypothetical protein
VVQEEQPLLAFLDLAMKMELLAVCMEAAAAPELVLRVSGVWVQMAQFALFGLVVRALPVHSHQLTRVICNGTVYPNN